MRKFRLFNVQYHASAWVELLQRIEKADSMPQVVEGRRQAENFLLKLFECGQLSTSARRDLMIEALQTGIARGLFIYDQEHR